MLRFPAQGDLTTFDWELDDYVLVVDDDDDSAAATCGPLEARGHRVVTFQHGGLALDYLQQKTVMPRVILLDLVMPDLDGWKFLSERRLDPRIASVPVVAISGSDRAGLEGTMLDIVMLLRKPVPAGVLLDAVERCPPPRG